VHGGARRAYRVQRKREGKRIRVAEDG
jgi:hypothetical protein